MTRPSSFSRLNHDQKLIHFCTDLLKGVRDQAEEIDLALRSVLDNWKLERVAIADRNILRLGVYEMLFTDTPGPVVINECVEIAKRYGNQNSHQFVNGILGQASSAESFEIEGTRINLDKSQVRRVF